MTTFTPGRPLRFAKRAVLLFTALLLSPLTAQATAQLQGVVKKNEVGGEGMAQVAVAAADANPGGSDSLGLFRLIFPTLQPGEKVVLSVSKPGWVVVNDLQLETNLPKDARANPLTVLLSKPGEKLKWALVYYRLKGKENADTQYRARLAELERDGKATAQERDRLVHERDTALAQAEELAKQLAAQPPASISTAI